MLFFASQLKDVETGKITLEHQSFRRYLEELRFFVLFTSDHSSKDLKREFYDKKASSTMEKAEELSREILVALEFRELAKAAAKYKELLHHYAVMPQVDQHKVYPVAKQVYAQIHYVNSVV